MWKDSKAGEYMRKTEDELYEELCEAEALVKLQSVWRHVKTDNEYRVVSLSVRESDCVICVNYWKIHTYTPVPWCRPLSEFLDGRFVKISVNI